MLASVASVQWVDKWYPSTVESLVSIAGTGFDDPVTGAAMPNLSAIDTVALLGLVTPAIISAIDRYNKSAQDIPPELAAVQSIAVTSDGLLGGEGTTVWSSTPYVDSKTYLSYGTDYSQSGQVGETPWKRFPPLSDTVLPSESYEVYVVNTALGKKFGTTDSNVTYLQFVRQMIADYQRMVYASTSALYTNSADCSQPAPAEDLSQFLSSLRALCGDFDTLNENPPAFGDITGALHAALAATSEFVGKAAADISKEVGKVAGIVGAGVTGGFLENAGILSVVVVGIAIHLFLH